MNKALYNYRTIVEDVKEVHTHVRRSPGSSGWEKRTDLMSFLIYYFNLKTTLDLGVFTGGSLFPQAKIHNKYTGGVVYGVDPYTMDGMTHHDCNDPEFLKQQQIRLNSINVEEIYQYILNLIKTLKYKNNIIFLRQSSIQAISYFKENNIFFDLMSIDGSHDTKDVMSDIELYVPRLNDKGFLVMDDINWNTVKPAYEEVKRQLSLVYEEYSFAVFRKSNEDVSELRTILGSLT